MGIAEYLFEVAKHLIEALGYWGLAFGLVIDSAGVPIPSEVLIPLAGALAFEGKFNMIAVIVVGTLAQLAGAILAYYIGLKGGIPFVKRWGKYVFFSEHELAKTHKLFERRGQWITLIGRCLPGIRTYVGYPAGIAKMPFTPFVIYSAIGSFVWTVLLAWIGYAAAEHIETLDKIFSKVGLVILAVAIGLFIWYLHHSRNNKKKAKSTD